MLFQLITKITKTFMSEDKQVVTKVFQVEPEYVVKDQRTMHQYFSDAIDNCLAEDDLVEMNTEGPFLFDAKSGFRSIKAGTIKIRDFVKSNDPSSVVGYVGTYVFVMNVAAKLKGVNGPLSRSRGVNNPDNSTSGPPNMLFLSAGQQTDAPKQNIRRRSPSPEVPSAVAEEAMIRNRAYSNTAMTRAEADTRAGNYNGAIVTLLTAISLLKQSKLAGDDRTRVLIGSLKDCPYESEERSRYRESKSRRRDRRERSRSRERSDYYHGDRSRDRDSSYRHERHRKK